MLLLNITILDWNNVNLQQEAEFRNLVTQTRTPFHDQEQM